MGRKEEEKQGGGEGGEEEKREGMMKGDKAEGREEERRGGREVHSQIEMVERACLHVLIVFIVFTRSCDGHRTVM